ncbi:Conserved oligomeric Golgi complex subunit 6 [Venturia inaequalis]|nr:Conserved oligomeric Golgi complex subunit 6 [Venturia inaequalis]
MPSTLDTIPAELRLKIYRNLLILPRIKLCDPSNPIYGKQHYWVEYGRMGGCGVNTPPQFLAILSVCKLIRTEALEVLFSENMFVTGECLRCYNSIFKRLPHTNRIKSMTFLHLEDLTERNRSKIIEHASGLTYIVICRLFWVNDNMLSENDGLSKDALVRWKQLKPGQIVPLDSGVYQKFPKFSQAQMTRFAAKATKIGTQITAIANVNNYSDNVYESFAFRFKLLPISKKRVKAENHPRTYDLLLLGIE